MAARIVANEPLTAERLRELLNYDPVTGVFTRRAYVRGGFKVGDIAGGPSAGGYRTITVDRICYHEHVLAWFFVYGKWPVDQLDHKNTIRTDNAIGNLRECNTQQNCAGRVLRKDSPSGYKGVSLIRKRSWSGWRSRIRVNYVGISLGCFPTPEDAARAYDAAAIEHFGEFARTNKSLGLLP